MMMRVGLVACSRSKTNRPVLARDLYTSPLFRMSRKYVERTCARWFIMSAKHGLVRPEQVLAPYDQTLLCMSAEAIATWGNMIDRQLEAQVTDERLVILAGEAYLSSCMRSWPGGVELPLSGLPLGKRLKRLKEMLA